MRTGREMTNLIPIVTNENRARHGDEFEAEMRMIKRQVLLEEIEQTPVY